MQTNKTQHKMQNTKGRNNKFHRGQDIHTIVMVQKFRRKPVANTTLEPEN